MFITTKSFQRSRRYRKAFAKCPHTKRPSKGLQYRKAFAKRPSQRKVGRKSTLQKGLWEITVTKNKIIRRVQARPKTQNDLRKCTQWKSLCKSAYFLTCDSLPLWCSSYSVCRVWLVVLASTRSILACKFQGWCQRQPGVIINDSLVLTEGEYCCLEQRMHLL